MALVAKVLSYLPFSPDNDVRWVASLPLCGLLGSLVYLLIEARDTGIQISLEDFPPKALKVQVLSFVD